MPAAFSLPQPPEAREDWSEEDTRNLQFAAYILAAWHRGPGFQDQVGSQEPGEGLWRLSAWTETPRKH